MTFTGKPSEGGEKDLMEDDPDESRPDGENQTVLDLFDDDDCAEAVDVNEAGELQSLTGILICA